MDPSLFRYIWRFSRREQILILLIIVASLPFYWISLDVPKSIVNDAIQGHAFKHSHIARLFAGTLSLPDFLGGTKFLVVRGIPLHQMEYLFALSAIYFVLVLLNGWFKYLINVRKGVLGELMLKRLRFDLFALLLRFRPEDIHAVKPAEVASMIKDEVEPIGAFIGDAFIQPAFLGTQALTALGFIMLQNIWMGLVALAIVLVQAVVIPYLRREQIRLGRERQLASRKLAGRIGEIVDAADTVHVHGAAVFMQADVDQRLLGLYRIRVALFRRKFSVKYLNNLLAQLTPFFFYAIGGYFALHNALDIGQLVAVVAAYRDLPPPIKELIDWDQQRNDVEVKYEQIVGVFTPEHLLPPHDLAPAAAPPADAAIVANGLFVIGARGNVLLERMSLTVPRPAHVALIGLTGSGRDILAKLLGRQITEFHGTLDIGGRHWNELTDETACRFLAYTGPDVRLLPGSIRDNIVLSLMHRRPRDPLAPVEPKEWIDYSAAGVGGPDELDIAILEALAVGGARDEIYRLGISGRLAHDADADMPMRLVEARQVVRQRLDAHDLTDLVEPFDPTRYNMSATIGENLLFGVPVGDLLAPARLAQDPYTRSIVAAEGLTEPLTEIGLKIAEATIETFADLPPGHPLFERFSFIHADDLEGFRRISETARTAAGRWKLTETARMQLISLAYAYIEPRHRLGLVDRALEARILRARESFKRFLPHNYAMAIEFYDPERFLRQAPILDNLLFGRVDYGVGNADQKVSAVVREALEDLGLINKIYRLGLDYDVGVGGRLLQPALRVAIDLARCLIRRPDILVVDGAFGSGHEADTILAALRIEMSGRTLFATLSEDSDTTTYDHVIAFDGPQLREAVQHKVQPAPVVDERVANTAA